MKKTIKAWAILSRRGNLTVSISGSFRTYKHENDAALFSRGLNLSKPIPCTITYSLPKKAK